jgi:hypothetical protein
MAASAILPSRPYRDHLCPHRFRCQRHSLAGRWVYPLHPRYLPPLHSPASPRLISSIVVLYFTTATVKCATPGCSSGDEAIGKYR